MYYAGQMVQGTIYIRAFHRLDARHIEIQVKGKEKGSFIDIVNENYEENG